MQNQVAMRNIGAGIALAIFTLMFSAFFGLLKAVVAMWLWNYAVVPLGLPPISFWHAWALGVLIHWLFQPVTFKAKS